MIGEYGVIDHLIKEVDIIGNIAVLYQGAHNEGKRAIIGSVFPEKLYFDKHYLFDFQ